MIRLLFTLVLAVLTGTLSTAAAQVYPSRPITMVVPLGAGGSTDVIGRIVGDGMRARLGQPVIVENAAGAGGTIGVGRVARAAPDGYTILIGQWGTNVASGAIYPLQFDLQRDFEPIALIATQPFLIVSRKSLPANNLTELIDWLKKNADKATQGNSGVGTPSHVGGILFQKSIGVPIQMVPYRSAGLTMQALLSGEIDMALDTPALEVAQVHAGTVKAYAVTADHRLDIAPEIPTTDEAGLAGFHFSFWHALWAPKGTPANVLVKLNEAAVASLADPRVRSRLSELAQDIFPREQQTPQALAAFHKAEIEKWWPIIKAAGITLQ